LPLFFIECFLEKANGHLLTTGGKLRLVIGTGIGNIIEITG